MRSKGPQGDQLTFDDIGDASSLLHMPPERLFDLVDAPLLQRLQEDSRLERKGPNVQPKDLGEYFAMWANTPEGGLIVVGQHSEGTLLGLASCSAQQLNDLKLAGATYCPDARYDERQVPVTNAAGKPDFVLVFFVHYHETKAVCTASRRYFKRVGDQKREIAADELSLLRQDKGEISAEQEPVSLAFPKDFDYAAIRQFAEAVKTHLRYDAEHTPEDVLELRHLGRRTPDGFRPNLACALIFARDPSQIVPGAYIRFLRFEGESEGAGEKWNAVKDEWIEGNIPAQIQRCEQVLKSQLRTFSKLGKGGKFFTSPEYPEQAWYEAIVNASVHRTYSNGMRNANIMVKMFDDRLVVESPGPFPPHVTPHNISEVHHPRNPKLMNAMYYLDLVKCAHEGIRRMKQSMKDMELPEPEYVQEKKTGVWVSVTLRNRIKQRKVWVDADVAQVLGQAIAHGLDENQKRCVNFVAEHGAISVTDAQRLTGLSWATARKVLQGLVEKRILAVRRNTALLRDSHARYVLRTAQD